ncbi:O-antigen ligase family protein [Microbulbifer epialgicus]|uniref:O-antigen ligase family protein n=1 Tax=Microbulbifer epialgicus TaxID=393907 RepID=A0ABV4P4T7_9GAMM
MQESGSNHSPTAPLRYLHQDSKWIIGLLRTVYLGLFILLCGFYLAPKESGVQTTFYLTLLPATLLLLLWRRDYRFAYSWQFAAFCSLSFILTLSTFWADGDNADVIRETTYYWKLLFYLAIFYCAIHILLEQYGDMLLRRLLLAIITVGFISGLASLIAYGIDGGFQRFYRIGGISLEGNIDKTGMLFGFHALFCCYGLTRPSRLWRWVSWTGLVTSAVYILLSQTKIPIVMVGLAILLAAMVTPSRLLKAFVLVALFAIIPITYSAVFGDLPLLHRGNAYAVRLELWRKVFDEFMLSPVIGSGLVHKQFIELNHMLPHPHNYLLDVARFSGLLGIAACVWQGLGALSAVMTKEKILSWIPGLYVAWFLFGTLAMLIYAQQPLVKPNYIWFFYWAPLAILLARSYLEKNTVEYVGSPSQQVHQNITPQMIESD